MRALKQKACLQRVQTGFLDYSYSIQVLQAFKHRGNALPHTDTHGGQTEGTTLLLHHIEQGSRDAHPRAAKRMA